MRTSKAVTEILELMEDTGIEIVSYGLAPNPFGFCFERGEDTTNLEAKKFSVKLNSLSERDERELRKTIFGICPLRDRSA